VGDATPAPEFYNMVYMVMNFIDLNKENGNYSRLARIENTKISAIIKSKFKRKHKYDISQAYLKCLELLRTVDIFDNKKSIKAFHVCEAPGQFIIAFTDFCKHKKIKYDWLAQSLNPKEYPKNDNIFGDYYGIIAANPERWIYGKNNTGDISNPDIVREYIEMANNSFDIATSDCGFNFGSGSDHDQSKMSYKIAAIRMGQYLSVTNTLKIGGSCFFKIFLPASHINVLVILQMMHEHFEDVIYFKPYLNAESPEFYVIGKNLRTFYTRDEREVLFKLLVNANKEIPYKSTVPIGATFYASHKKRIETILLNYSQAVNYQIYLSLLDDGEEQWNKVISIYANKFKNKILLL
jgi:23S rRNA U2552 (ribose-2'-O)-methylase RlmE/FtsJ